MPLIDPKLKEILVCPQPHHAPLIEDEAASLLRCTECGLGFPVQDGIPVMLLEEAIAAPEAESQKNGDSEPVQQPAAV